MDLGVILVIALAPSLFWLWFFYKQDDLEPEPLKLVAKMYLLGMVITIPVLILEEVCGIVLPVFLLAVLVAPVLEECSKFLVVREVVYNDIEFDEPLDGIVYSVSVALGFATIENAMFLVFQPSLLSFAFTGIVRALFTIPAHALFAVFWGYTMGVVKFHAAGKKGKYILATGLLSGIAVHGLFNFLLLQNFLGFAVLILIIFPAIFWIAEDKIHKSLIDTYELANIPIETG
jgi:RsiW-degrading membrane proteinase PrsW (M82 family)